jgi:dTMP kinase
MRGYFISFEGGEGTGKSTQIKRLANWLTEQNQKVITTREPGGTDSAEAIRTLLLNGDADRWNKRSEALLFAAARADHVDRLIKPALAQGQWVLTDRYIDSSRAYQSAASGLDDKDIMALHEFGSDGLLPDLTFLMTIDPAVSKDRLHMRDGDKGDRIQDRENDFHDKVRNGFLDYASQEPERFRIIDGDGSIDAVHARITAHLAPMLS